MAIAFVGASSVANSPAVGVHVITVPQPVSACNALVAILGFNGAPGTVGAPAGWTLVGSAVGQANPRTWMYYRGADGAETSSCTWTTSTSIISGTGMILFSGTDSVVADAAGKTSDGAAANSASLGGVTTVTASAMIVSCVAVNSATTGITIADDVVTNEAFEIGGKKTEGDYGQLAAAGQSGSIYYTFAAARAWAGVVLAIRPASAVAPPATEYRTDYFTAMRGIMG